MDPVHLFSLTSQQNKWLAVRQTTIAGNIANANTPGFKAQDVTPFEATLSSTRLAMATTRAGHVSPPAGVGSAAEVREDLTAEVLHSGNSVHPEEQLMKSGEVNRMYSLNSNLVRTYHKWMLAAAKG